MMRIGKASDIHQLVNGRKLILGGVEIEHRSGCLGHSDADVLLHAVGECILGALAMRDLGTHFSDQDPKYKDMNSQWMLEQIYLMMVEQNYHIVNIDATVMIEEPKLAPYIPQMIINISTTLHCDCSQISVKATRGEGLGFVGRKEGVFAECVCLIDQDISR